MHLELAGECRDGSSSARTRCPVDWLALAPFPLGRSLGWRQLIALEFLNLRGRSFPAGPSLRPGETGAVELFCFTTTSRASPWRNRKRITT